MSKKIALFLILAVLAVSGCAIKYDDPANNTSINFTSQATATPVPALLKYPTAYVEIFGSAFNPPELNIVKGTTVQWLNKDSGQHAIFVNNTHSPALNKRDTWNHTFNVSGTYEYNCTIQPWIKHGRIIVK